MSLVEGDAVKIALTEEEAEFGVEEAEVQEIVVWMSSFGPNRRSYFEELGEGMSKNSPSIQ